MRDWLTAFRPASFRGVPFKVDGEGMSGQRRLSISPIAYADASVIEDMGRDPMIWPVTAYLSGDFADREAQALTAALSLKGPGLLVLPMHGAVRARAQDWRRDRRKDYAGHVAISISFIEEGFGSVPFGLLAGAGPIADMLLSGKLALGAAFAAAFDGLLPVRLSTITADIARAATRITAIAAATATGDRVGKLVATALEAVSDKALAAIDAPQDYAGALLDGWRAVALNAEPAELRAALTIELMPPASSAAGEGERAAMAGALAIAAVRGVYPARPDARAAREAMGVSVSPVIASAGTALGYEVEAWVAGTTGEAARILSRIAADRAPLVRVETPLSLSAVVAAYQMYGDANRARELVDRNRVATAAFMPVVFEAVAS